PVGPYTVMVYAYRTIVVGGVQYRETSTPGLFQIRVGSVGNPDPYPGYVTDAKCNACHGDLRFHGNTRKSVNECVMCHAGGVEYSPAGTTVNFKVMIHKIHNAENLTVVQNGGMYLLGTNDFSDGTFPYMQGGARNCTACHATDAWQAPVERSDTRIW